MEQHRTFLNSYRTSKRLVAMCESVVSEGVRVTKCSDWVENRMSSKLWD